MARWQALMSVPANQGDFFQTADSTPVPGSLLKGCLGCHACLTFAARQQTQVALGKKMSSRDNIERKKLAPVLHLWKHLLSGDCSRRSSMKKDSCKGASGSGSCYHHGLVPGRVVPDYLAPVQISGFPLRLPACKQREFFSINTAVSPCPQSSCWVHNPLCWPTHSPPHHPQSNAKVSPRTAPQSTAAATGTKTKHCGEVYFWQGS